MAARSALPRRRTLGWVRALGISNEWSCTRHAWLTFRFLPRTLFHLSRRTAHDSKSRDDRPQPDLHRRSYLGHGVFVSIVAEVVGYSTRASIETGILLSQTSEFSLLLAMIGVTSGQINAELFSLIAVITVSTMTLTPFVSRNRVAWSLMKLHPRHRKGKPLARPSAITRFCSGSRAGARLMQYFLEHNIKMVVVDDDAAVIRQLIRKGIPCIQGDGSDIRSLELAHGRQARVVICSMRRTRDAKEALNTRKTHPLRSWFVLSNPKIELIEAGGGYPVRTAQASAKNFLEWLD